MTIKNIFLSIQQIMIRILEYVRNPKPTFWFDTIYADKIAKPDFKAVENTKYTDEEMQDKIARILESPEGIVNLFTEVWGEYSPLTTKGKRVLLSLDNKGELRILLSKNPGTVGIPGSRNTAAYLLAVTLMAYNSKDWSFKTPKSASGVEIKDHPVIRVDWLSVEDSLKQGKTYKHSIDLASSAIEDELLQHMYLPKNIFLNSQTLEKVISEYKRLCEIEVIEVIENGTDTVTRSFNTLPTPRMRSTLFLVLAALNTGESILVHKEAYEQILAQFELMAELTDKIEALPVEELAQKVFFYEETPCYYNHSVSKSELLGIVTLISRIIGIDKRLLVTENKISFENQLVLEVREDGVYDEEERRALNMVLIPTTTPQTLEQSEIVYYVNGFGGILLNMINSLYGFEIESSMTAFKWYRDYLSKAVIFDHTVEIGAALEGDRQDYDLYSAKLYEQEQVMSLESQWDCFAKEYVLKLKANPIGKVSTTDTSSNTYKVFNNTGLVALPKGDIPLVDGRLIYTRWSDASPDPYIQLSVLQHSVENMVGEEGNWIDELKKLYPDLWFKASWNVEEFLRLVLEYGILLKTTKAAKLKRPLTRCTIHGVPLGKYAMLSGLKRWGNPDISQVHGIECILAPYAVNTPGQAISLTSSFGMPSRRQSSDVHFIENFGIKGEDHKIDWSLTVESFIKKDGSLFSIETKNGRKFKMVFDIESVFKVAGQEIKTAGNIVSVGDIIATVGYTNQDGQVYYHTIEASQTCFVKSIQWELKDKLGNDGGKTMKFKVVYDCIIGVSNDIKGRENIKTTFGGMELGRKVVFNKYNKQVNLNKEAQAVFPQDTLKYPDLLMSKLDVAALCIRENYGDEWIYEFNENLFPGSNERNAIIWNDLAAAGGAYDNIIKWFEYEYAQNLWLEYTDLEFGGIAALKDLYTNKAKSGKTEWVETSPENVLKYLGVDFTDKSDIQCLCTGWTDKYVTLESLDGEKRSVGLHNVLVFYASINYEKQCIEEHMLQYSLCYAGTGGLRLIQPMKTELGAVKEAVCECNTMATVTALVAQGIPGVYEPNLELAKWLGDNTSKVKQWEIIRALYNKTPILGEDGNPLPTITLISKISESANIIGSEQSLPIVSPELVSIVKEYEDKKRLEDPEYVSIKERAENPWDYPAITFKELVEIFSNVVINVGTCNLYLPALIQQEADPKSEKSLNGIVRSVLLSAILGSTKSVITSVRLIAGALKGLAESSEFLKGVSQGQPGLGCRALGLFGIHPDEVIVVKDNRPDTFYTKLVRLFEKQGIIKEGESIDGLAVMDYRAPIIFYSFKRIRLVEPGSLLANQINAYQCGIHTFGCYVSGGDYDGDIYYFVPIPKHLTDNLKYTTVQIILDIITLRTGKDALSADQGGYIADHWDIKIPNKKSVTSGLLQPKHFGTLQRFSVNIPKSYEGVSDLDVELYKKANKATEGLLSIIDKSCEDFSMNVGSMYQIATRTTLLESFFNVEHSGLAIYNELVEQYKDAWFGNVTSPLFELYVTNHGDYNKELYYGNCTLTGLLNGLSANETTIAEVSLALKEGGLNPNAAKSFIDAALYGCHCKSLKFYNKEEQKFNSVSYASDVKGIIYLLPALLDELLRAKIFRTEDKIVGLKKGNRSKGEYILAKSFYQWLVTFDPENTLRQSSFAVRLCDNLLRAILPSVLHEGELANVNKVFYAEIKAKPVEVQLPDGLILPKSMRDRLLVKMQQSSGTVSEGELVSKHQPITSAVNT